MTVPPPGLYPFWFWNARIRPERIRAQLAAMAEQGIRGVYLHPRQGLAQPYLGSAFLGLVETAVSEAASAGLAVGLYDEYPYPSGAAGGAVISEDPALAGSRLRHVSWDGSGGEFRAVLPPGRVAACLAFPRRDGEIIWDEPADLAPDTGMTLSRESCFEGGLGAYSDRRYFASAPLPALETVLPPGEHHVAAAVLVPVTDHKYWGGFPDVLSPAAVRRFIELTHERYARRLGPRLGAVWSVFTDEVAPWPSAAAVAEFARRAGAAAGPLLIALGEPGHPRHLEALGAMTDIQLELFEESFEKPVAAWCRGHGLRYAGEKPSLRLSQLRWLDVPGCEPGHVKAGAAPRDLLRDVLRAPARGNARATASAAYLYGKPGALCECYHSLGWDATLQDARLLADVLIALGIRWLVPHAFFYSVHGLRKHDAPPSFFHMPYWPLFGSLTRHVDELWRHLDGTFPDAAIAVIDPSWGLPGEDGQRCYEELQLALVARHLDWLTVDTDVLAASTVRDGAAHVKDVAFRAVAVPPMRRAEPALERWLRDFEAAGGTVARIPDAAGVPEAAGLLARRCPPSLPFTVAGQEEGSVLCAARALPGGGPGTSCATPNGPGRLWLVVNTGPRAAELTGTTAGVGVVRLDGEAPPAFGTAGGEWMLRLEPFQAALLAQGPAAPAAPAGGTAPAGTVQVSLAGQWEMRPCSPNVLRLGHWRLRLAEPGAAPGGAADGDAAGVPVTPAPLANQLRQGGLCWRPGVAVGFGQPARLEFAPLRVAYTAVFECAPAMSGREGLRLAIEPDSIGGRWELRVNGAGPFGPADLAPADAHTPGCLGLPLDGLLRPGRNEVSVTVAAGSLDDGLRNALYVAGGTGVEVTALPSGECRGRLVPPARAGAIGDWAGSGLPFYAGAVEYQAAFGAVVTAPGDPGMAAGGAGPGGTHLVTVRAIPPSGCEGPLEIAFGDGPWHPLPWSPWQAEVPAAELAGAPAVRVRLYSGLARAFEGRWFDPVTHRYRDVAADATARRGGDVRRGGDGRCGGDGRPPDQREQAQGLREGDSKP